MSLLVSLKQAIELVLKGEPIQRVRKSLDKDAEKQFHAFLSGRRKLIDEWNKRILKSVHGRLKLIEGIGAAKVLAGETNMIVDLKREKETLGKARKYCVKIGLDPSLGEVLMKLIIYESRRMQKSFLNGKNKARFS